MKLAPAVLSMSVVMTGPAVVHLPPMVSKAAKDSLAQMEALERAANAAIIDPKVELPVVNMKQVQAIVAQAKKAEVLASQMMAGLSKFTGS